MTTYKPTQGDYIAYNDSEIFIVWNSSFTFNVYDSEGYEFDVFTDYRVDEEITPEGIAMQWAENYHEAMTEGCYND